MTILCIDGFNFLHRARAGFTLGDYPVVFNFFRNLRALVEMHKPTRIYFVLEGHPEKRYELLPEYKANRRIEVDDAGEAVDPKEAKKLAELTSFFRQAHLIVDLLTKHFPISVVRHPTCECDDVIYNLINRSSTAVPWVVVSNDSDFTQLLNEFKHVKLYNPISKTYVEEPPFDYVTWKALRGDGSDNIPGIPGIGDQSATEAVNDPDLLRSILKEEAAGKVFLRNYQLIKFPIWSEVDAIMMTSSEPKKDWDAVAAKFDEWLFKSILKEKSWDKYKATFDPLWG